MVNANGECERTIQRTGSGTYTVSLPKEYIRSNKLSTGSTVRCVKQGRILSIVPESLNQQQSLQIEADSVESAGISTFLILTYRAGIDSVLISGDIDLPLRQSIRDASATLIGTEIVRSSSDEMELQTMVAPSQIDTASHLKQMARTTTQICNESVKKNVDTENLTGMVETVTNQENLLERVYHLTRTNPQGSAIDQLGRISDHLFIGREVSRIARGFVDIACMSLSLDEDVEASVIALQDEVDAVLTALVNDEDLLRATPLMTPLDINKLDFPNRDTAFSLNAIVRSVTSLRATYQTIHLRENN